MAYYVMLGEILLPITPSAMNVKTPSMNKTVTLINEGEINIPKDQGLREISFEFLIPTVQKYPFANWQLGSYTATMLIPLLNIRKRSALPLYLNIVRMSPAGKFLYCTRIYCLIEDFDYKEDAEEYGLDTMCSINLKEYVPYSTKRIKIKEPTSSKPGSTQSTQSTQTKTAKVEKTRDASSKSQPSKIKTDNNKTIVSGSKYTGDSLGATLDANDIKIPESIKNPSVEDNSWMGELDIWTEPTDHTKTMSNLDSYSKYLGGNPNQWNQGRPKLESLADTILGAPSETSYARPTPPIGAADGKYASFTDIIGTMTNRGFNWRNMASGI